MTLVFLVCAATFVSLAWLTAHGAAYGPLYFARAAGWIDGTTGSTTRSFERNALAVNPDAHYRYLPYAIPAGHIGELRVQVPEGSTYYSVIVYDRLLQSIPWTKSNGPTWRSHEDAHGGTLIVRLVHALPGHGPLPSNPHVIDVTQVPKGVLVERFFGAGPQTATTFAVRAIDEEVAAQATSLRLVEPCPAAALR